MCQITTRVRSFSGGGRVMYVRGLMLLSISVLEDMGYAVMFKDG
jgi:hypothetical protein